MRNETAKTTFFYQLKVYGIKRFLTQLDSIIFYIVFLFLSADNILGTNLFVHAKTDQVIAIFAAASTLFAITLAALAIILSFSNSDFMSFLRKNNKLSSLLFLFWVGNGAYLVVITLSILYFLLNIGVFGEILYVFIVSFFSYSIVNTGYLLATVIRFGYFIDIFEKLKKDK